LELAAFRYGIGVPRWFNLRDKSYEQRRNRYNIGSHFDLQDLLTNFSASMFAGGLNLAANILGKPGKMDIAGHMVQDLYDKGDLAAINGYCQCDVLDTYFVFLRASVMTGDLDLDDEQRRVDEMHKWLEARVDTTPAFGDYLECWGQWENPWTAEDSA
jgi:predicted PolB exonuclease-like 3'-5' exonuclease